MPRPLKGSSWAKLPYTHSDPELQGVSPGAFRLHINAWSYCHEQSTDGYVSPSALKMLGGTPKRAAELVEARIWEPFPGEGWQVIGYLDHNLSRERVQETREKTREKVAKHRRSRAQQSLDLGDAEGL